MTIERRRGIAGGGRLRRRSDFVFFLRRMTGGAENRGFSSLR